MPSAPADSGVFSYEGRSLAYTSFGEGSRVTVLVHGLLFDQRMHGPLARTLAKRDNRVVTVDLLGHGTSDRPRDLTEYSMPIFAQQVLALMDHLEIDQAVIGGTSLGANVTLETAVAAPSRVRGMIVEMPVLDNALLACALAFTPLMVALTFGERAMRLVQSGAKLVPNERLPFLLDLGVAWLQQDPAPSAAVIQGLFFGRTAPPRSVRRTIEAPALVIGHRRDPVHPFSDSGALVEELPNAKLLEADSILEMRVAPRRLSDEMALFIDSCWKPREAAPKPGSRRRAAG